MNHNRARNAFSFDRQYIVEWSSAYSCTWPSLALVPLQYKLGRTSTRTRMPCIVCSTPCQRSTGPGPVHYATVRTIGESGGREPEAGCRGRNEEVHQRKARAVPTRRDERLRPLLLRGGVVAGQRHVPDVPRPILGDLHGVHG